ncbi:MAG: hypothetical protein ACW99F_03880 [Candidatus Hodarchaeales archaeon]|jgi:hypothetical protein
MEQFSEENRTAEYMSTLLSKQYRIKNYDEHYRQRLIMQKKAYIAIFTSQFVLFLASLVLPWYRFIKVQTYGETFIIDAGALDLNDWTPYYLVIGSVATLVGIVVILRNSEILRTRIRTINLIIFSTFVMSIFAFMAPEFSSSLSDMFHTDVGFYIISTVGFSIYPHIGYIIYLLLAISVFLGFVLSLFWRL